MIQAGAEIRDIAQDESIELSEILNQAQEAVFELGQDKAQRGFHPIQPIVSDSIDAIEKLYHKSDRFLGIPTGFMDFDQMTSGLQPRQLHHHCRSTEYGKDNLGAEYGAEHRA